MIVHFAAPATPCVALRKESVDRNVAMHEGLPESCQSLSARRAWIEMSVLPRIGWEINVALRKESVDRNRSNGAAKVQDLWSLSARRAWIEIVIVQLIQSRSARRSPQGERG